MNEKDCSFAARAIGSMFLSIAFITDRTTGAYSSNKRGRDTLAGFLHGAFTDEGEEFVSIDDLTHTLQARDTNGPLETASVKNWKYNDASINFDIHDFGGGNGHIILPFEGINGVSSSNGNGTGAGTGTTVDKRDGKGRAPGFKVSYTTRKESKLTKAHGVDMANKLALDWTSRAISNDKLSNYIGLWKTDHDANFYFRVIPESKDFNMNYETVDSCGGMARFL